MSRPKGYKQSEEVKAKISASVTRANLARPPVNAEYHRSKIKTGKLISRLHAVGVGEVEASPTSVQACIALLRKTLPDLASVEHKHDALVTLRTIITGVVRHEDLVASPTIPQVIEHNSSDCNPSASSSVSPASQTEEQTERADLIEKEGEGGGE